MPNRDAALVASSKITGYLLSETHRDGKHKPRFFESFGFCVDDWKVLEQALRDHVCSHNVAKVEASPFGTRYVVEGTMKSPDGCSPYVRSVWFVENDDDAPRFVTAYPLRGGSGDD